MADRTPPGAIGRRGWGTCSRRCDARVPSDGSDNSRLHSPLGVGTDAVTEMACEHLGTKTNAQKRRVFLQRDPDPVYLAAQPGVFVVDAHGTAKNDHTCVISKRFRQRIPNRDTGNRVRSLARARSARAARESNVFDAG